MYQDLAILAAFVFVYGVIAGRVERMAISGPIVFTAFGLAFGPLGLKACRDAMVHDGLARNTVNSYVGRVRRMFRWGTENELVPVQIYQALTTVTGLQKGRTEAKETRPAVNCPA